MLVDNSISLKFIYNLVQELIATINSLYVEKFNKSIRYQPDFTMKVTEVLLTLQRYKTDYLDRGVEPKLKNDAERNLFETFKSYINYKL